MDLRKLPPSMVFALGLACGDDVGSDSGETVGPCLSPPYTTGTTGTSNDESEVGPCLSIDPSETTGATMGTGDSTVGEFSTGPCLSIDPSETTGSSSDSGSDSGSSSDSGSGSGTTSMGMEAAPPSASRAEALRRMLDRGTLPADVAERLLGTPSAPEED